MDAQLEPKEALLAHIVRVAIRDARQAKNEHVREDAAKWLWRNGRECIMLRQSIIIMGQKEDSFVIE